MKFIVVAQLPRTLVAFLRDNRFDAIHIHHTVTKIAWEFISAATHFQVALARKMDLAEYVYGQRKPRPEPDQATPEPADPPASEQ